MLKVELADDLAPALEAGMARGGFSTADAYVESLLRLEVLRSGDAEITADLRREILKGLEGTPRRVDAAEWESVRREARSRSAASRRESPR